MKLKKVLSLSLCAVMALSLAACGNVSQPAADVPTSGAVQPASNFVDCVTLEEAIETAGIDILIPGAIDGYDNCIYRANKTDGLIEVIFENENDEIRFRKGTADRDISGNYNEFAEETNVDVDGTVIYMRGADGKVNLATWSRSGYAYSIDSTVAVDKTVMTDLVKTVNSDDMAPIGGDPATWGPGNQPEDDNGVQPASPFRPCDTMADAAALAGFDMTLPETADGLEAVENEMIQALYGENGDEMLIRKALGSEDISGDYNIYAQTETVNGVTLKGENGQVSLALWTDGGYTYSISVGEALSQADMLALVNAVK